MFEVYVTYLPSLRKKKDDLFKVLNFEISEREKTNAVWFGGRSSKENRN